MKNPRPADSKIANGTSRSPILDALRAVAILLVLGRHTNIAETLTRIGWCGVDLFFVISGFLISGLLFQEYKRFGNIRLKTFWLRRGFKIYPAFYVYTLVTALLYPTLFHWRLSIQLVLNDAAFLSSYFEGLSGHTWSLAVEEHFYIFLPLLLLQGAPPFAVFKGWDYRIQSKAICIVYLKSSLQHKNHLPRVIA